MKKLLGCTIHNAKFLPKIIFIPEISLFFYILLRIQIVKIQSKFDSTSRHIARIQAEYEIWFIIFNPNRGRLKNVLFLKHFFIIR